MFAECLYQGWRDSSQVTFRNDVVMNRRFL